jgi:uncharacterized membrane protein YidH (DUF202 family)
MIIAVQIYIKERQIPFNRTSLLLLSLLFFFLQISFFFSLVLSISSAPKKCRSSLLFSLCFSCPKQQGKRILSIFLSSLCSSSILGLHLSLSQFLSLIQAAKKKQKKKKELPLSLCTATALSLLLILSFCVFSLLGKEKEKRTKRK